MFIKDNKQYNNLINEWECLYNDVLNTNWNDKFDIYVSNSINTDLQTFIQDDIEKHENNFMPQAGVTLPPYKNRKSATIILNEQIFANEQYDTFFHEYTHAIHMTELCSLTKLDQSMIMYKIPYASAFHLWSEARAAHDGLYFELLLNSNTDTLELENALKNKIYVQSIFDDMVTNLSCNGWNSSKFMQFIGEYLLLDEMGPAEYHNCGKVPFFIINRVSGVQSYKIIETIIKRNTTTDKIIPQLRNLDIVLKAVKILK